MAENKVRAHVQVKGRVQGVFFRAFIKEGADSNSVTGWVRNMHEGTLEAVLEGPEESVKKTIDWIRVGPPNSIVEDVNVDYEPFLVNYTFFEVKA
jgi:acylphosphatase